VLKVSEVAKKLGVHQNYVYQMIDQRQIEFLKLPGGGYRISEEALKSFLSRNSVKPKSA
jgi:excisionase family DNA binding protein